MDETFIGHDTTIKPKGEKKGRGYAHKHKVLSLVDRDTSRQRSMFVGSLRGVDLTPILRAKIAAEAVVMIDEASQYRSLGTVFAGHGFTRHGASTSTTAIQLSTQTRSRARSPSSSAA